MTNEANDRVSGRVQRSTSSLLRNLRSLRTIVFHPRDSDGEVLTEQLKRIGCQVVTMWPPLAEIPDTVDVVFCAVRPDHAANECKWMGSDPVLPIIAIVNYENPTILDAALRMGALTVLTTPARASEFSLRWPLPNTSMRRERIFANASTDCSRSCRVPMTSVRPRRSLYVPTTSPTRRLTGSSASRR